MSPKQSSYFSIKPCISILFILCILFINSSFSDVSTSITAFALVSATIKCEFIFAFLLCRVKVQLPVTGIFVLLYAVNLTVIF